MTHFRTTTRARIIAATAELLELQGYNATGLNEIIQSSSTPKGSLYFHFPGGKEELAAETILKTGAEIAQQLETTLMSNESVAEAISDFVLVLAAIIQNSDFRKGCPVTMVAMETSATSDRLRQACKQTYSSWFNLVEQRLRAAGFDASEAKDWTTLVWASMEGAILLCRTYRSTEPLETVAKQMKKLLIHQTYAGKNHP